MFIFSLSADNTRRYNRIL